MPEEEGACAGSADVSPAKRAAGVLTRVGCYSTSLDRATVIRALSAHGGRDVRAPSTSDALRAEIKYIRRKFALRAVRPVRVLSQAAGIPARAPSVRVHTQSQTAIASRARAKLKPPARPSRLAGGVKLSFESTITRLSRCALCAVCGLRRQRRPDPCRAGSLSPAQGSVRECLARAES